MARRTFPAVIQWKKNENNDCHIHRFVYSLSYMKPKMNDRVQFASMSNKSKLGYEHKFLSALSKNQRKLARKHGIPSEFAAAVYRAVPGFISMDEAELAVLKYEAEWNNAA